MKSATTRPVLRTTARLQTLVKRWDAAPKAQPGLLMREQMRWPAETQKQGRMKL
jgi:hypothetical protein